MSDSLPAPTAAPAPHTHRVTVLIAVVAILLGGYTLWRIDRASDRHDATRDHVQTLEAAQGTLRAELNAAMEREVAARTELARQYAKVAEVPQQLKDLTAAHEDLRARSERPQRAWTRAEALFLIELAQRRLSFDFDVATAIEALAAADARMAALRDPALNPVRERLAQDLQALRAVPEVDRVGTMARITAVESQANTLPLKGVLAGQRSEKSSPAPGSAWSRAWRYVVNSLSELFVVHRLDADSQVVSLDMQALRRQHFSMLAFSARHAVLRSDQAAFHDAVEQMQAILAQHYAESAATDAASGALGELLAVNIAPKLPNVNGAAQLLKSGAGAQ